MNEMIRKIEEETKVEITLEKYLEFKKAIEFQERVLGIHKELSGDQYSWEFREKVSSVIKFMFDIKEEGDNK